MSKEFQQDTVVPVDHPCLEGHFPGNPVVPGTIILQNILKALAEKWPAARVSKVVAAKFLAPLKPGEQYSMRITRQPGIVHFECSRKGLLIATGRLDG